MTLTTPFRRLAAQFSSEERRLGEQIDRNFAEVEAGINRSEVAFSQPGGSAVKVTESGPWTCRSARRITEVVAALGVAGTANTVLEVRVNGAAFPGAQVTLASGATNASVLIAIPLVSGDVVTVAVTTAGASAKSLVVQLWFG